MSTLISPSSPALRSRPLVTAKFLASISAAAGITSLVREVDRGLRDLPVFFGEVFRREYVLRLALLGEEAAAL